LFSQRTACSPIFSGTFQRNNCRKNHKNDHGRFFKQIPCDHWCNFLRQSQWFSEWCPAPLNQGRYRNHQSLLFLYQLDLLCLNHRLPKRDKTKPLCFWFPTGDLRS
jgi:hypothetical protein